MKKPKYEIKKDYAEEMKQDIAEKLGTELGNSEIFVISNNVLQGDETLNCEDYELDEKAFMEHIACTAKNARN